MKQEGPILVPLDGSETAESALACASAIAEALRAEMVLVTVHEDFTELAVRSPSLLIGLNEVAREHYSTYLSELRERLRRADIGTIVRRGKPATEILKVADEIGARLIVMSTHGRSGLSRWLYGSTAGHLLRESAIAIVAVGPDAVRPSGDRVSLQRIMVPLDGSPLSEQALPVAELFAKNVAGRLLLVRCAPWAVQMFPYALPDGYVPQLEEALEKEANEYLKQQMTKVPGVAAEAFVIRGPTAHGLIGFVEKHDVDLVVMTTHARAGIARAALGSIADRMLGCRTPVMLIRPEPVNGA